MIRKRVWPTTIKTFRTKQDAQDWGRRTEDEMVRSVYIDRADSDRLLLKRALDRYLHEVSSAKRAITAYAEQHKAKALKESLGAYSLAAITSNDHALGVVGAFVRAEATLDEFPQQGDLRPIDSQDPTALQGRHSALAARISWSRRLNAASSRFSRVS